MTSEIYVEGGGETNYLKRRCREGLGTFLQRAGVRDGAFRVVASGPRNQAHSGFCNALRYASTHDFTVPLVDSESDVEATSGPWQRLHARDKWKRPGVAEDHHAQLMVQCMESWFLADREALADYFGREFKPKALPARKDVENVDKDDVLRALTNATRHCQKKGIYRKARHSFDHLARIDPRKVIEASPYTRRLVETLTTKAEG